MVEQANQPQSSETAARACPVTEPVWVKPPEDDAVQGYPEFGYYFVNEDRSMWASAWWVGQEDYQVRTGEEGIKVGWFRPAGARLKITGQRLDGAAPPLEVHVPGCLNSRVVPRASPLARPRSAPRYRCFLLIGFTLYSLCFR
jgi:hypothetical protein